MNTTPAAVEAAPRRAAITSADYPRQRYFSETHGAYALCGDEVRDTPTLRVYRHASSEFAQLCISLHKFGDLRINLTATDLRRLASDLLDAAHDIDQHPAEVLS